MMKKIILSVIVLAIAFNVSIAQDTKKAAKKASRSIASYFLDKDANQDRLKKAVEEIEVAITGEEQAKMFKTWETRGKIYSEVSNQIYLTKTMKVDAAYIPDVKNPALIAYESYVKASEFATKKSMKKKVFVGLASAQNHLYNMGLFAYDDKDYEGAYMNFEGVLKAHDILKAGGKASAVDADTAYVDQVYFTAVTAEAAGNIDVAKKYYEQLYAKKADKAGVYSSLYNLAGDDLDAAYKYLEEGRKLFPDDISLLFAEINHFLKQNKLDELISKLKLAIEKEPNNVSLYTTLGNVYDNLYQTNNEEGNTEKATTYFSNALEYYEMALAKDVNSFDAIYSLGALYYNKAAGLTVLENKTLEKGMSRKLVDEADAYKVEATANFEKALPYFKKAEGMNPNDMNTLIALKEIAVRMNDFETSGAIKERLKTVQDGGKNETSYYKN